MKCVKCEHEIEKYEHYVELEDGTILDETCFFNMALEKLNAKSKQEGFKEDEEDECNHDCNNCDGCQ